jgi:hypothetical protein
LYVVASEHTLLIFQQTAILQPCRLYALPHVLSSEATVFGAIGLQVLQGLECRVAARNSDEDGEKVVVAQRSSELFDVYADAKATLPRFAAFMRVGSKRLLLCVWIAFVLLTKRQKRVAVVFVFARTHLCRSCHI